MAKNASPLESLKEKATAWLSAHPHLEAFLWFIAASALIAILVWFTMFSGFGAAPEFVYEQF